MGINSTNIMHAGKESMRLLPKRTQSVILVGVVLATSLVLAAYPPALADPPCVPGIKWLFRPPDLCAETIVDMLQSPGIASISGIAFGPDGSLYFARPATGPLLRLLNHHHDSLRQPTHVQYNI